MSDNQPAHTPSGASDHCGKTWEAGRKEDRQCFCCGETIRPGYLNPVLTHRIKAEDLTAGQPVTVSIDDHRLIRMGGEAAGELTYSMAVVVDRPLAGALADDMEALQAFADHLESRTGWAWGVRGQSAYVSGGEQRLWAVLGHPGSAEDSWDAYRAVEELLSKRLPGWGRPRHAAGFPDHGVEIEISKEGER